MAFLQGKKIIVGITGSIAAYKTPQLVRLLVRAGADVQVIMTEKAKDFVTPLSLSTVSGKPVLDNVQEGGQWHNHVLLGRAANLMLIAPCSANTLARMARGLCDNMLLAVYLSAVCPVVIAPAMDEDMWQHPATKSNVEKLRSYGHSIIPVGIGELASGLTGAGRMAEPEDIISFIRQQSAQKVHWDNTTGRRALVSAGPTYEAIDPVRFLGNHSTGKMGTALALALAGKGYIVDLVAGPGVPDPQHPGIQFFPVVSAQEMFAACSSHSKAATLIIMAAAVADYRPEHAALQKIKKSAATKELSIKLVQNPDILAYLGQHKTPEQTLVGFALETENEFENALKKCKAKNADFIVLNSLNDKGAGFGTDTNKVTVVKADGTKIELPLQSKQKIAEAIISEILN
ncbi:MAG TPA: bifunctional phosphopantothenoylcysteine decarboxylase/phosphopantothenate--cysteine ligase CoaBC [Edaphocola sp.]|nr:bifunctional phosphopantothenoylcysteine decarboxylase/phosphopantothenate--cysteine ligase CoaBC [Edaphocola sp.]